MKFETLYRRLLHTALDQLLDISEEVRAGVAEHHNKEALAERFVRKNVFDDLLRSYIVANRGKERVVEMLRNEIETRRKEIAWQNESGKPDVSHVSRCNRAIVLFEEMIDAFKSKEDGKIHATIE